MFRTVVAVSLLFLTFASSWTQSAYFIKDYPAFPGYVAAQAFFHPQGGYSVLFAHEWEGEASFLHRMDNAGEILYSYQLDPDSSTSFEAGVAENGNHWVVSKSRLTDGIHVNYLDDTLGLRWDSTYTLLPALNLEVRANIIVPVTDGVLIAGYYFLPTNRWGDLFLAKIDSAGNLRWNHRYTTAQTSYPVSPDRIQVLNDGRIAISGVNFLGSYPNLTSCLLLTDPMGNFLHFSTTPVLAFRAGNIHENTNGTLQFMSGFNFFDYYTSVFHTDLLTFSDSGSYISDTLIEDDWAGKESIKEGNTYYGLMEGWGSVKFFSTIGGYDVAHPQYPVNDHGLDNFRFNLANRHKPMDSRQNGQQTDLLIALGAKNSSQAAIPILTLTNLQGSGITERKEPTPTENQFQVYPNPAHRLIHADWKKPLHFRTTLYIFDLKGRIVFQQDCLANCSLDVSGLAEGMYTIQVRKTDDQKIIASQKILLSGR